MSDKHTPTPWEVAVIDSGDTAYGIYGPNGEVIADIPTMAHCVEDADARYLVRAVNAHDALVSALDRLLTEGPNESTNEQGMAALYMARTGESLDTAGDPVVDALVSALRAIVRDAEDSFEPGTDYHHALTPRELIEQARAALKLADGK